MWHVAARLVVAIWLMAEWGSIDGCHGREAT